jgi:hypothetical protein
MVSAGDAASRIGCVSEAEALPGERREPLGTPIPGLDVPNVA